MKKLKNNTKEHTITRKSPESFYTLTICAMACALSIGTILCLCLKLQKQKELNIIYVHESIEILSEHDSVAE